MTNPKTLARTENPQTSKDAAERMVKSGELNRQEQNIYERILAWTRYCNDFTTKDIASCVAWCTYDKAYDICRKRFSGLERKGKIVTIWTNDELWPLRRDGCRVWRLK